MHQNILLRQYLTTKNMQILWYTPTKIQIICLTPKIISYTFSSFIWTSSPLPYLFVANVFFISCCFKYILRFHVISYSFLKGTEYPPWFFPSSGCFLCFLISKTVFQCYTLSHSHVFFLLWQLPHNILVRSAGALKFFSQVHILKIFLPLFWGRNMF